MDPERKSARIDAEILRRLIGLGGLDIPQERAAALLPLFTALMSSCDRLVLVDPTWADDPPKTGAGM